MSLVSFLLGILVGGGIALSLGNPAVGGAVARILAVVLLGLGTALLVWPLLAHFRREEIRPISFGFDGAGITTGSEAIAWSAGCLVGGIAALVLSFLRPGKRPTSLKE